MTSYHNILQQNICVLNVFEKLSAESWPPLHALRCHKQALGYTAESMKNLQLHLIYIILKFQNACVHNTNGIS